MLAGNGKPIPFKFRLSSDWGLQPDPMKSESVVIADQHAAVNTFSGLVHTARQANKVGGGRRPCKFAKRKFRETAANLQGTKPNSAMGTKS